jgi:hypothetical protein
VSQIGNNRLRVRVFGSPALFLIRIHKVILVQLAPFEIRILEIVKIHYLAVGSPFGEPVALERIKVKVGLKNANYITAADGALFQVSLINAQPYIELSAFFAFKRIGRHSLSPCRN